MNIILIGFTGVGKSTIGKGCCDKLGYHFVDTDREIEKRCQKKVGDVFKEFGEEKFRQLEKEIVEGLVDSQHLLLSTGGGTVLLEETRSLLKSMGKIVYLKGSLETLVTRMTRVPAFLVGKDIKKVAEFRFPIYEELADIVIETDRLNITEVSEKVCDSI